MSWGKYVTVYRGKVNAAGRDLAQLCGCSQANEI